jgi:LuxR family maltose regulon positive regulatory protein
MHFDEFGRISPTQKQDVGLSATSANCTVPSVMFTKLAPLRYPKSIIERSALLAKLRCEEFNLITLFQAPSGYGKTVAMAQWRNSLIEAGHVVAWLNLSLMDNEESEFLLCLLASLRKGGCEIGDGVFAAYQTGAPGRIDRFLAALVNELWQSRFQIYLLIDNLNRTNANVILDFLARLVEHAPDNFHLGIASSSGVSIDNPHIRSRTRVVATRELAFSYQEASMFFGERLGANLKAEELRRIHDATEGWPLAMKLAVLAIQDGSDPKLCNDRIDGRTIDRTWQLIEDSVSHLTSDQLNFLVATAFLENLHPDLCGYVTGFVDAGECLELFSTQAIFLQPIEGNPSWFRCLPLFAEFFRSKFNLLPIARRKELLLKASEWMGAREYFSDAADYSLQAGRIEDAVGWVTRGVLQLIKSGKLITAQTLIDRIPEQQLASNRELKLSIAFVKSISYQFREAERILEEMDSEAASSGQLVPADLFFIRARVAYFRDDSVQAHRAISQISSVVYENDPILTSAFCNASTYVHFSASRYDEARAAQQKALHWAPDVRGYFAVWLGRLGVGLSYFAQADIERASAIYLEVLSQAEQQLGRRSVAACMAAACLADAYYERGQLGEVMTLLANRMDVIDLTCSGEFLVRSNISYSRTLVAAGESQAAIARVDNLLKAGELRDSSRIQAAALTEKVRMFLNVGELDSANLTLKKLVSLAGQYRDAPPSTLSEVCIYENLAAIWIAIADKDYECALTKLKQLLFKWEGMKRWHLVLQLRTLEATCLQRLQRDWTESLKSIWQMAERNGLLNAIVDAGPVCGNLIQLIYCENRAGELGVSAHFVAKLYAVQDQGKVQTKPNSVTASGKSLLTETERNIVALVAKGLANKQIANILSIGVGTVKWHLHNIYGKLDAPSRRNVADIARRHGLLT